VIDLTLDDFAKGFDADLGEGEGFAFVDIVYPELAV